MSMPVWIALLVLVISGGFLISQRITLDSAAESAVLSAASEINTQAYYQSGTLVIGNDIEASGVTDTDSDSSSTSSAAGFDADDQPNIDPCSTASGSANNPLLCTIQTVLCQDYNSNPTAVTNCEYQGASGTFNSSCLTPSSSNAISYPAAVYVCNQNGPPTGSGSMITYYLSQPSANQLEVQVWYTYPNPLGHIFVNQLTESTSQFASPAITPCTNGATSC